jgi:hypothetical protein
VFVVSCLISLSQLFVSIPLFRFLAAGVCQYLFSSTAVKTELSSSKHIDLTIVYEQGHRSENRCTAPLLSGGAGISGLRTSFYIGNTGVELEGAATWVAEEKDLKIPFVFRIQVLGVNSTPVPHLTKGAH